MKKTKRGHPTPEDFARVDDRVRAHGMGQESGYRDGWKEGRAALLREAHRQLDRLHDVVSSGDPLRKGIFAGLAMAGSAVETAKRKTERRSRY